MKKMFQKTVAMAAVGLMALASGAQADTLALYPFTGSSLNSTDTDPNSTAGPFTVGPGFTGGTTFVQSGTPSPSIAVFTASTDGTDQLTAVTAQDYFSFTISPNSGFSLNLDTLTFDTSTSSINANYFVRSSVDAFTSNLASFLHNEGTSFIPRTANVSGASFDSLTLPTEFRFYIFDGSTSTTANARLDSVTLTGTTSAVTAVPEPGTVTLMLLGGLAGAGGAARKRKRAAREKAESHVSA